MVRSRFLAAFRALVQFHGGVYATPADMSWESFVPAVELGLGERALKPFFLLPASPLRGVRRRVEERASAGEVDERPPDACRSLRPVRWQRERQRGGDEGVRHEQRNNS